MLACVSRKDLRTPPVLPQHLRRANFLIILMFSFGVGLFASQIARVGQRLPFVASHKTSHDSNTAGHIKAMQKSLDHLEAGVWEQKVYSRLDREDQKMVWALNTNAGLHAWMGVPQRSTKRNPSPNCSQIINVIGSRLVLGGPAHLALRKHADASR